MSWYHGRLWLSDFHGGDNGFACIGAFICTLCPSIASAGEALSLYFCCLHFTFVVSILGSALATRWCSIMGSMGIEAAMSEASTPSDSSQNQQLPSPQKRSATEAGLKSNGIRPTKSVKRRASKACQCCRSRKVRCNVVEHGAPCTNCRLDEVECIVSESKRKK